MNLSLKAAKVLLHCQPAAQHMNTAPMKVAPVSCGLRVSSVHQQSHCGCSHERASVRGCDPASPGVSRGTLDRPVLHPGVRVPRDSPGCEHNSSDRQGFSTLSYCLDLLARKRKCSMEDSLSNALLRPISLSTLSQN